MTYSSRSAFLNCTNQTKDVFQVTEDVKKISVKSSSEKKRPLARKDSQRLLKRAKLLPEEDELEESEESTAGEESESEDEERREIYFRSRFLGRSISKSISEASCSSSNATRKPYVTTGPILQSFVSSNKSDVFKCQSSETESFLSPPYACAFSNDGKRGGKPLLAVATEQGSVEIIETSRRKDWHSEPPRSSWSPHRNGIFDIKWNNSDTLLATASGDQSVRISDVTTTKSLHSLQGHTSTVKCVAWDRSHPDQLSSGARDGSLCVWDLRVGECASRDEEGVAALCPVISIIGAHGTNLGKGQPRKRKGDPASKSVTSVTYADSAPHTLITSGSVDGILRAWDTRLPGSSRKSPTKPRPRPPILFSSADPTVLHSARSRGINDVAQGSGPTAGLLFALGADSRVHKYALPSLTPYLQASYSHRDMQLHSFYVRLALSPCGRWLATGNTGNGNMFLFDVSNAGRPSFGGVFDSAAVELKGQIGEVGALDWADGMLATCADDGTVRVWRPDAEVYQRCLADPEEGKWDWSWSVPE